MFNIHLIIMAKLDQIEKRLGALENKSNEFQPKESETVNNTVDNYLPNKEEEVRLHLINSADERTLIYSRKKEHLRIGVKSVKNGIVERSNHAELFNSKDKGSEKRLVKKIIEVRESHGHFKLIKK